MARQTQTVRVTAHALHRWRERAAEYADASADDLIRAVMEADLIAENDHLPFHREPAYRYFRHVESKAHFVLTADSLHLALVVSVIVPGLPGQTAFLNPKTKKVEPKTPKLVTINDVKEKNKAKLDRWDALLNPERQTFDTVKQEREWLIQQKNSLDEMLPEYPKRTELGKRIRIRLVEVNAKLDKMRETATEERLRKEAEARAAKKKLLDELYAKGEMFWPDTGDLNHDAAIRILLDRTAAMQKEIDELKRRTTTPTEWCFSYYT